MIYEIKRGGTVVLAIRANGQQHRAVMIEDRVQMDFRLPEPITFQQGDTVEVFGQIYKLNRAENVLISHDKAGYHYNMEFEALYYDLGKWELNTYDRNNQLKESEVFLMCDADTLMDLIVANANRVSSGWTKGVVEPTEVMMYTYTSAKLLTVLQDLADKNHTEFWVEGKTINLSRKQPISGMAWEFGKDHELYELYRNRSDSPMINRLKVLGGTRNIPLDYGFKRLQPTGGNPISTPALGDIIEHTVVYENVYPSRKGSVTSVLADNEFSDSAIDFNLNNYKLPTPAKVAFTTGQLAGFVFSITEDGYNHDTRTITLNVINDDPAYPSGVPNPLMKPAIGDEYVLLDISLPTSYITAKENTLKSLGESYLVDYSISRYEWGCRLKPKYILEEEVEVELGSIVNIKHTELGIDHDIRISGYVRDLQEPYRYDVTLSNIITISELVRQRNASDQMSTTITRSGISDGSVKSDDTLQTVTTRGATTDRAITVRGTRNQQLLSIPANAPLPEDIRPGENYIYVGPGSGAIPPEAFGNLEDLQNVASPIPVNKFLYKGPDGIWVGVDVPGQDLSAYASKVWVGDNFYSKEISDGLFVTQATDQFDMPGNKGWTGRHHFDGSLAIPQAAPVAPDPTKVYIYVGAGSGATPPSGSGNLEDLQNVANTIPAGQYLYKDPITNTWIGSSPESGNLEGLQNVANTIPAGQYLYKDPVTNTWIGSSPEPAENRVYWYEIVVNATNSQPFKDSLGINLSSANNSNAYDISLNTTSTSTVTGTRYFLRHNGVSWVAHKIGNAPENINHPRLVIVGGVPVINTPHATSYLIQVNAREYTTKNTSLDWVRLLGLGFDAIQNTPTTVAGYGIADAAVTGTGNSQVRNNLQLDARYTWQAGNGGNINTVRVGTASSVEGPLPSSGFGLGVSFDFKLSSIMGISGLGIYSSAITMAPWTDNTGNNPAAFRLLYSAGADKVGLFVQQYRNDEWKKPIELLHHGNAADLTPGMIIERYRDPSFKFGDNNITAYPSNTGTAILRITDSTSPTGVSMRYTATGWAQANVRITFAGMGTLSSPGKVFITRMIAKVPVGWKIQDQHNAGGTGAVAEWLTDNAGTGAFKEYLFKYTCGVGGSFGLVNYFDLRKVSAATPNPSSANPVVSYLAFAVVTDQTESAINTRLRIPTTPPDYPLPGDMWVG